MLLFFQPYCFFAVNETVWEKNASFDSTFVRLKHITEVSNALQVCFVVLFIINQDVHKMITCSFMACGEESVAVFGSQFCWWRRD